MTISNYSKSSARIQSSFIREILAATQQPDMISFAGGLPDPNLFPKQALLNAFQKATQKYSGAMYQYGESQGLFELREWIAKHSIKDTHVLPEQIMITNGTQQGLDMIARVMINPGDPVLVESPSYVGALQVFRAAGAEIIEMPCGRGGPDINALNAILESGHDGKPFKLCYLMPNFQNPTGLRYSLEKRHQLTALFQTYPECRVLEDDPYGRLIYEGAELPSLFSLMPTQTFRLVSFSKTIAPSLRLGWLQGTEQDLMQLNKIKQVTDLHSSNTNQIQLLEFLKTNEFEQHLERLISHYREKRDLMAETLNDQVGNSIKFNKPTGGMFIWCQLIHPLDTLKLANKALNSKIAFVPGDAFFINQSIHSFLRLNFSHCRKEEIIEGVQRLKKTLELSH